jgi:hypothetical protein
MRVYPNVQPNASKRVMQNRTQEHGGKIWQTKETKIRIKVANEMRRPWVRLLQAALKANSRVSQRNRERPRRTSVAASKNQQAKVGVFRDKDNAIPARARIEAPTSQLERIFDQLAEAHARVVKSSI